MYGIKCDICIDGEEGIRHITASLEDQEIIVGKHIHICRDCYNKVYSSDLRDQIERIEMVIMKDIVEQAKERKDGI